MPSEGGGEGRGGEGKESNHKYPGRRSKGKGVRDGERGGQAAINPKARDVWRGVWGMGVGRRKGEGRGRSGCFMNVTTFKILGRGKIVLIFLLTKGSDSNAFELK